MYMLYKCIFQPQQANILNLDLSILILEQKKKVMRFSKCRVTAATAVVDWWHLVHSKVIVSSLLRSTSKVPAQIKPF